MKKLAVIVIALIPALALAEDKNSHVSKEINNNTPVAQPPRDTGGRDIKSFNGYQGTPREGNRAYDVPSPVGGGDVGTRGGTVGGTAGARK